MDLFTSYNEREFVCLFRFYFPLFCSVWNYVKRYFSDNKKNMI